VSAVLWVLQFLRGGALAGLFGVVALAFALLVGLIPEMAIALYPAAALVAVVYAFIPNRSGTPQIVGAASFGAVALGSGVYTGLGFLEVSGIVGAVAAIAVLAGGLGWKERVPVAAFAVIALILVVANMVPLVLDGGGLNHDESAYALKARHWIEDTPETGWNLHRGVAMSAYGYLVLGAGGDEGALRLWGLAAIVGFFAATWVLGNKIGGKWVGPLSAIALLSSPDLLRRSTEYLSDVPSSAFLVAVMVVVWNQFGERDRPGYGLLWMLPFALAAFYVRYQSVLSFGLIAVAIVVLFWKKIVSGWRPIALTAGLGFLGLIPHFVFATSETGSPLGIILFTADVAGRDYFGQGLVDYFLLMGWPLAAYIGPVAAVFFVWWLIADWGVMPARTKCMFLVIPAVGQVLILGALSHGEGRFIFFPLALTLIGGVTGATVLIRRWRPTTARAVSLGLTVLLIGSLALTAVHVRNAVESRATATELIEAAAGEIKEMSDGESCGVMTSYFPQVTFLSECYTQFFRTHLDPEEALSRVSGENRFLLIVEDGKNQPEGRDLDRLIALTTGRPFVVEAGGEWAEIYEFAP
jgi:hypothetical protein